MSALGHEIAQLIAAEGPITVERYMGLALGHPRHGYYITGDPLGREGDFTTAPEISQMFGELIGLWAAETWRLMGSPAPFRLVELGPGRGTLMQDALRAARVLPAFMAAARVHLVETSPVLRQRQQERLAGAGVPLAWHADSAEIPDGPAIVIANEFFDALPIRQFQRTRRGWCERLVGLDEAGHLAFGLAPEPATWLKPAGPAGAVLEWPGEAMAVAATLAQRLVAQGGAALAIDYGHEGGFGDTLQALRQHAFADVLAEPGEADITAHVNFAMLGAAAAQAGAALHGPIGQGAFLQALGLDARAAALKRRAGADQAQAIDAAAERLTAPGPTGMGELFRVLAFTDPRLGPVPALPPAPPSFHGTPPC